MNSTASMAGALVDHGCEPHDAALLAEADAAFEGVKSRAVERGWHVNRRRLTAKVESILWRQGYRPCLMRRGALRLSILGVWVRPDAETVAALDAQLS